ncbi:MAG: esterase/lipase family protein [Acutalibacteraceae bacterium]
MKRFLSAAVAFVILFCTISGEAFALVPEDVTELPVVIVPGYSASQMYYTAEDGSSEHVWGVVMSDIVTELLSRIADVGRGLRDLVWGNPESIAKTVGEGFIKLYGKLACNDDGSSMYNLSLYYSSAEETNSAVLMEKHPDGNFRHEIEIMSEVAQYVGNDMIFNFNCDFRMSAVDCAIALDTYIEDVLSYTGAQKVNIIAISHGGQVTATYLSLYGYKKQVNNAVLNVPAIGGAGLAYDVLKGDFDFDEKTLLQFVEYGLINETDYNWLVEAERLGFLDAVLNELQPYVLEILGNWESIWDFIPLQYYEEMKAQHLDPVENAALIASSDFFHYSVMPMFNTSLQSCNEEYDMHVSIIAGTDIPIVTGLKENSDGIITTASSTGALVAPYSKRFSDGYTAINCDNSYVSPAMTVDASTAYLPETTWFVEGLFHGMEFKDSYSASLLLILLLTDEIQDVYSNADFPRFHATTNAALSVFAQFNNSVEGYVSSGDTSLIITNLSKEYSMKVIAVTCNGMDIVFNLSGIKDLSVGESVCVPFSGNVPAVSKSYCNITITYILSGTPTFLNERKLNFTIDNGEAPCYELGEPYTDLNESYIGYIPDDLNVAFQDLGILRSMSILLNVITYLIKSISLFTVQ